MVSPLLGPSSREQLKILAILGQDHPASVGRPREMLLVGEPFGAELAGVGDVEPVATEVGEQSGVDVVIKQEADRKAVDRHYSSSHFGSVSQV